MLSTTKAIERLNMHVRTVITTRSHVPRDEAAGQRLAHAVAIRCSRLVHKIPDTPNSTALNALAVSAVLSWRRSFLAPFIPGAVYSRRRLFLAPVIPGAVYS